jgi:pimeloyl-ACP methyl ester carboxylesterase
MPVVARQGLKLHVQLLGAAGAPPLALLHGLFVGSLASWYFGAAPRLAARYRVLLHDVRGHGLSERAPSGYDLATLVGDLEALLPDVGGDTRPVTLVGHSYGALTAMRFALAHPARVARLVLVDAPLPPSHLPELDQFLRARPEDMVDSLPAQLKEQVVRGGRQASRLVAQLAFLAAESTLLADLAREPDFTDAELASIAAPTTLIYGERSSCRPAGERLARVMPAARLELLPGGHFLPSEAPGALADRIVAALLPAEVIHG